MDGASDTNKFAEELQWCITQLELGLQSQSPDSRQAAETFKVLKILKSTKAPLVKKRQAMRNALGDYRKKMREAEKKSLSGLHHSRFQPIGNLKVHTKSRFLRQSYSKQRGSDDIRNELQRNMNNLCLEQSDRSDNTPSSSSTSTMPGTQQNDTNSVSEAGGLTGIHGIQKMMQNNVSSGAEHGQVLSGLEQISNDLQRTPNSLSSEQQNLAAHSLSGHSQPETDLVSDSGKKYEGNSSLTPGAENSFQISKSAVCGGSNFRFIPSDNSFCFGFEVEDAPNEEKKRKEVESIAMDQNLLGKSGGDIDREIAQVKTDSTRNVQSNFYKFEKSNNEFCFGFQESSENL